MMFDIMFQADIKFKGIICKGMLCPSFRFHKKTLVKFQKMILTLTSRRSSIPYSSDVAKTSIACDIRERKLYTCQVKEISFHKLFLLISAFIFYNL